MTKPFENLNEREREILHALIDHYIRTADPVGSRILATRYPFGLSPATIRNTMQDLESRGLVEQPHMSAGRVPTDAGYRLYVDNLLRPEQLTEEEKERIRNEVVLDQVAVDRILEQTSRVLAGVSHQLGVTIAPSFEQGVLTRIDLVPVTERKLLVIIAVKSGLAKSVLLEVDVAIDERLIGETARLLNERLAGLTLGEIKRTIRERLSAPGEGDPKLLRLFLNASDQLLSAEEAEHLHIEGTANVVNQPEFKDHNRLTTLFSLLEERKSIVEMLNTQGIKEGIVITIGSENPRAEGQNLSVVTSTYQAGKVKGTIGVIGPTRMPYSKLVSVVDYTAKVLSEIFS